MRNFDDRLEDLRKMISESLKDCKRSIMITGEMIKSGIFDKTTYGEAKSIEEETNLLELSIDKEIVKAIARFQPMAVHLRTLLGLSKFGSTLERINDLSLNILKVLKHSNNIKNLNNLEIYNLFQKIEHMYDLFLKSYYEEEISYSYLILSLDEEVNAIKDDIIEKTKDVLKQENKSDNTSYLEALFISQHYEKIGDNIKNLAESLIFILNGEDIRHQNIEDTTSYKL